MNNPKCGACRGTMKRNGKTKSGAQRWRCKECGASITHRIDRSAKHLKAFLRWLMSNKTIKESSTCSKDTFRRRNEQFWKMWPLPIQTGEIHDIVFVDGIYLSRRLVVLIACSKKHVLAWHLAESERAEAWAALLLKIPPPTMVVTDGGYGFKKAAKAIWPNTHIQRCLVHVSRQVRKKTTSNPNLECGKELLSIAKRLTKTTSADDAAKWLADYASWCCTWENFLREFTLKDGKKQYVHERLRSARHSLNRLVREGVLFTFIEMAENHGGKWDSTNNVIEGGVNAQIRNMLHAHRGLSTTRRIKAVFWWCFLKSEHGMTEADMIRELKNDKDVEGLFALASKMNRPEDDWPEKLGKGISWNEFHTSVEYRP